MKDKRSKTETTEIFASRLNYLVERERAKDPKGMSEGKVADNIGINRPSLHKYLDNDAEIGINNLVKIAEYFNVSTDFLLGRTDASPSDLSTRQICEATGLTPEALEGLNELTKTPPPSDSAPADDYYFWKLPPKDDPYWLTDKYLIYRPNICRSNIDSDIKLGSFRVPTHILPSRRTIITDLLSYESFLSYIDLLRDCVSSNLTMSLHEQFAAIHQYYESDIEASEDKLNNGARKYLVQEATVKIIEHLTYMYHDRYRNIHDTQINQYQETVDFYYEHRDDRLPF